MRIGVPRSTASRTTSRVLTGSVMLPGLSRSFATPASIAASAMRWSKWTSATIGTGERATIAGRPAASRTSWQVTRTTSQPAIARP